MHSHHNTVEVEAASFGDAFLLLLSLVHLAYLASQARSATSSRNAHGKGDSGGERFAETANLEGPTLATRVRAARRPEGPSPFMDEITRASDRRGESKWHADCAARPPPLRIPPTNGRVGEAVSHLHR